MVMEERKMAPAACQYCFRDDSNQDFKAEIYQPGVAPSSADTGGSAVSCYLIIQLAGPVSVSG